MGRRSGIGRLLLVVAVGILGPFALAAPASAEEVPSTLGVFAAGEIQSGVISVAGTVGSAEPRCLRGREVKVIVVRDASNELIDTARTSNRGGWHAIGPTSAFDDISFIRVKLKARKVGTGKKALRCGGGAAKLL